MSEPTAESSLYEQVRAAMTTGMTVADGALTPAMAPLPADSPITATSEAVEQGETEVRYHCGETLIASRTFRVSGRSREVMLGPFLLEKYERRYNGFANMLAMHERFLENLAGTRCVLRSTLSGSEADVWVPYYDWAQGTASMNAANLEQAIEAFFPVVKDQTVWDARDLPERVKRIAGPDPRLGTDEGSWRHLVQSTTPASLFAGLNEINGNLGHIVFTSVVSWHGQREVEGAAAGPVA